LLPQLANSGLLPTLRCKSLGVATNIASRADALSGHLIEHSAWDSADWMTTVCVLPTSFTLAATIVLLELTFAMSGAWQFILPDRATRVTSFTNRTWDALTDSLITIESHGALTAPRAYPRVPSVTRASKLASVPEEACLTLANGGITFLYAGTFVGARRADGIGRALDVAPEPLEAGLAGAYGCSSNVFAFAVSGARLAILTQPWATLTAVSADKAIET